MYELSALERRCMGAGCVSIGVCKVPVPKFKETSSCNFCLGH